MNYFCTYFDSNYLTKGIALCDSLKRYKDNYIFILCLDNLAYEILEKLNVADCLISLSEIEKQYQELTEIKSQRSLVEYYFTLTPFLPSYILSQRDDVHLITYLDADMFFYSDPSSFMANMINYSIGITPHRFSARNSQLEKFGKYNVGWLTFKNDVNGLHCLKWYRERCLEWCCDYFDGTRFADQKYLDSFSTLFKGVLDINNKGINAAPWNVGDTHITVEDNCVMIDDDELVCFHFHGLRRRILSFWDPYFSHYHVNVGKEVKSFILLPYLKSLKKADDESAKIYSRITYKKIRGYNNDNLVRSVLYKLNNNLIELLKLFWRILKGSVVWYK